MLLNIHNRLYKARYWTGTKYVYVGFKKSKVLEEIFLVAPLKRAP